MVAYVLDLFDQFYSCILVYEQLLSDRDKVVKEFDDQVVVLKRSSTVKDKDLNGVNTRLQAEVSPLFLLIRINLPLLLLLLHLFWAMDYSFPPQAHARSNLIALCATPSMNNRLRSL